MFSDIEAEKHKFHQHKSRILKHDVNTANIDKIGVFKNIHFGKKVLNISFGTKMILKN